MKSYASLKESRQVPRPSLPSGQRDKTVNLLKPSERVRKAEAKVKPRTKKVTRTDLRISLEMVMGMGTGNHLLVTNGVIRAPVVEVRTVVSVTLPKTRGTPLQERLVRRLRRLRPRLLQQARLNLVPNQRLSQKLSQKLVGQKVA